MADSIYIPDNQNPYNGGWKTGWMTLTTKTAKALDKLSKMSVWNLISENDVMLMSSSFGKKNISNAERKFLEIGDRKFKNEDGIEQHEYVVYTENIMGYLEVDGVQINIYSRFDQRDSDDLKEKKGKPKNYFLSNMLSKVCGISQTVNLSDTGPEEVFDLLALFFPKMLKNAINQGLYRAYRKYECNDMHIKGQIDVSRHLRINVPFCGDIAYNTREYDSDNLVTQLIRHSIEYLKTKPLGKQVLNLDAETRTAVSMIVQATPSYSHKDFISVLQKNITKRVTHPYYIKYSALQQLCIAILQHKRLSYGNDDKNKINGILFDGAWLWEEYVATLIKDKFKHYTESNSKFHLFGNETSGDFQKIIPDYLSHEGNDEDGYDAVADAKYMRLEDKEHLQGEQAYSVYYKTIMYMYRFNSKIGYIFHPVSQNYDGALEVELPIKGGMDGKIIKIGLKIPTIADKKDFSEFRNEMEQSEKEFKTSVSESLEKNNNVKTI